MSKSSLKTKTDDKLVREQLKKQLNETSEETTVLEELSIARGRARVDVVLLDQRGAHAYEIKSDADTLARLPNQVRYYSQTFSVVTLVVGLEHATQAINIIPSWWGVAVAQIHDGEVVIGDIRQAKPNPVLDVHEASDVLRKEELVSLIESSRKDVKVCRNVSRAKLMNQVREMVSEEQFINALPQLLVQRSSSLGAGKIAI